MEQADSPRIIFMFPGQGAQQHKMGMDVWQKYDRAREIFETASEIYGADLEKICFRSPFREMLRTDHAQILIATVSIVFYEILREEGIYPDIVLGHSAGELAALYASGAISMDDVFKLVSCRGKSMFQAAVENKGKMLAIAGVDFDFVQKIIEDLSLTETVSISNYNAPGEIVISGDQQSVVHISEKIAMDKIARIVDLKQQGAWHSAHMKSAQKKFAQELSQVDLKKPNIPMIFNYTADYCNSPEAIRNNLIELLTTTVKWYPSLCKLAVKTPQIFCEVGPNRILRGLLRKSFRKIDVDYQAFSVNDHDTLHAFIRKASSCFA